MTGKVLNGNPAPFLVLILPLAAAVILLYKAWIWVLGFIGLIIVWRFWDNYLWQQWCTRINPTFNKLIQENQGCITQLDLAEKAHLTPGSAKRFLERKSEEYGAYSKVVPGNPKAKVYYFITASTLGSIFDDSEPIAEETQELDEREEQKDIKLLTIAPTIPEAAPKIAESLSTPQSLSSPFAQLAELKEERQQFSEPVTEIAPSSEPNLSPETVSDSSPPQEETPDDLQEEEASPQTPDKLALLQVDLAKRLDTTPSTIGRRKTDDNFAEWSRSKDPDGIAWKYLRKSKMFVPVDPS